MTVQESLKTIVPGKTYTPHVSIIEKDGERIDFYCNSFFVGMYCAMHINNATMPAVQTGDHDNKRFMRGLKKDIISAIARGAKVEIDCVRDCTLTMT